MAEQDSSQEKTEEPTPRRLQKARDEGQVPRSKELGTTMVLVMGAAGLLMFGPFMSERIAAMAKHSFSFDRDTAFDTGMMTSYLDASALEAAIALAPWLVVVLIAAFAGPLLVGGWLFSGKAITPKLDRLNPLSGLKRMFSANSLVELFKAWAKVLVVGTVAWLTLLFFFQDAMRIQYESTESAIDHAITIIIWSVLALCASTALIAIVDVPWQIYSFTKKMRMSMQEIKDEYKETEGKPEVKSKVRQLQREVAQRRMMADVPEADVVITNPTHYSVALRYDAGASAAPVLLAKGSDRVALKIREIAKENNVPQMQAPPLARALYTHTKVGDEIPEGLYVAVAQVLAYIYQMDQFAKGKGPKPERKPDMPIPRDLRVDPDPS
ncbi:MULTISPECIES: flagellar biosynthesis protein FlhB [Thalassolituus]|uniref:flagellar biosynthesis protein FlhB n=1 Tax=Thalassolituus TaxID=187492 RepID=UPI000C5006F4|nr:MULTISPECIES: flagellar biosynthesis protein FlhB [Thalassolituus]MAG43050.1 flagellar biosynthetic protein FlhB [Oceanospirillaceae bacterium]MEC8909129.1 flagellar biosynthesis protein FlhB [Pseudomonadota bacterium]HCG79394.1 flagellar biosynthetic protein FlhB [Oceanospirillales bacterium]MAX87814.1 flagellar biosynthetic protein FlhB [Oceanospirillaceae bacterium]MEE3160621.1 flagellar biosynthesis protein FlhB [Pseudomonadota bacterium]|tara:strand:+ start:1442 stop:2587 length:1146 start_codon:yes stop_codon:yes gene_type:complete